MFFWGGGHATSWQIVLLSVSMIPFWGVVIWLGILFVKGVTNGSSNPLEGPDALRIVDIRFARGEIDDDEHKKVRDVLSGATPESEGVGMIK
jgi:putative membrane protein